jgi:hypothetical protein
MIVLGAPSASLCAPCTRPPVLCRPVHADAALPPPRQPGGGGGRAASPWPAPPPFLRGWGRLFKRCCEIVQKYLPPAASRGFPGLGAPHPTHPPPRETDTQTSPPGAPCACGNDDAARAPALPRARLRSRGRACALGRRFPPPQAQRHGRWDGRNEWHGPFRTPRHAIRAHPWPPRPPDRLRRRGPLHAPPHRAGGPTPPLRAPLPPPHQGGRSPSNAPGASLPKPCSLFAAVLNLSILSPRARPPWPPLLCYLFSLPWRAPQMGPRPVSAAHGGRALSWANRPPAPRWRRSSRWAAAPRTPPFSFQLFQALGASALGRCPLTRGPGPPPLLCPSTLPAAWCPACLGPCTCTP